MKKQLLKIFFEDNDSIDGIIERLRPFYDIQKCVKGDMLTVLLEEYEKQAPTMTSSESSSETIANVGLEGVKEEIL